MHRLIIHLGFAKTGSTSLQQSILKDDSFQHHGITGSNNAWLKPRARAERIKSNLDWYLIHGLGNIADIKKEIIIKLQTRNIFYSNETITDFRNSEVELGLFLARLDKLEIHYEIVILRRPLLQFLKSSYSDSQSVFTTKKKLKQYPDFTKFCLAVIEAGCLVTSPKLLFEILGNAKFLRKVIFINEKNVSDCLRKCKIELDIKTPIRNRNTSPGAFYIFIRSFKRFLPALSLKLLRRTPFYQDLKYLIYKISTKLPYKTDNSYDIPTSLLGTINSIDQQYNDEASKFYNFKR